MDGGWLGGSCGTCGMAVFLQATGMSKFGLYYGTNSSELSFSVRFAEEKGPQHAAARPDWRTARSRNGQWERGDFTARERRAGEVHGLGYVMWVYG